MSRARDNADLGDSYGSLAVGVTGGSGLNALSASNLSAGTVPDARFPATLPAASGTNLTALPADELSGTITSGTQDAITRLGTVTVGNLSNTAIVLPVGHVLQQNVGQILSGTYSASTSSLTAYTGLDQIITLRGVNSIILYTISSAFSTFPTGSENYFKLTYFVDTGSGYGVEADASNGGYYFMHERLRDNWGETSGLWKQTLTNSIGDIYKFRLSASCSSGTGTFKYSSGSVTIIVTEIQT